MFLLCKVDLIDTNAMLYVCSMLYLKSGILPFQGGFLNLVTKFDFWSSKELEEYRCLF